MEINGEGVKCKVCLDGGDNLFIWWSIWTVEIYCIYLVYLMVYLDGGDLYYLSGLSDGLSGRWRFVLYLSGLSGGLYGR